METVAFLPWDSEFFGIRIGRSAISRLTESSILTLLHECKQLELDCVYFLADSDDPGTVRLAETNGFKLVDIRITLEREIQKDQQDIKDVASNFRPYQPVDLPCLEAIACSSFTQTRYFADQGFDRLACEQLYITWLHNSINGYAQAVRVSEFNGQPAAFITLHHVHGSDHGEIGLLGVSSLVRGQGLGRQMVQGAVGWFHKQGVRTVSVVTQGRNLKAQRLYQSCGFITKNLQLWYHLWFH